MSTKTKFQDMLDKAFDASKLDQYSADMLDVLQNAPAHYKNEDKMEAYFKKHPKADVIELVNYWFKITPPGPAPGDDWDAMFAEEEANS